MNASCPRYTQIVSNDINSTLYEARCPLAQEKGDVEQQLQKLNAVRAPMGFSILSTDGEHMEIQGL